MPKAVGQFEFWFPSWVLFIDFLLFNLHSFQVCFFFLNKMFLDMFSVQHLINRAHNREDSEISSIASCIHLWFAFINHN